MSIYSYSGLSESSFLVTFQIFTTAFGHNAITSATVIIVMTDNQIRHCYGISMVGEHNTTNNSERRIREIEWHFDAAVAVPAPDLEEQAIALLVSGTGKQNNKKPVVGFLWMKGMLWKMI
jgi:hypothetical protein